MYVHLLVLPVQSSLYSPEECAQLPGSKTCEHVCPCVWFVLLHEGNVCTASKPAKTGLCMFVCAVQLPLGSTFKDPGWYAVSTALGNSNPVSVTSKVIKGQSTLHVPFLPV